MKPLCYDLYSGLGGWAEGFLAEGWDVIGFDIEKHDYGTGTYPGELRIRDVMTIHGSELADADGIVASPPCQAYSYRAMPWKRAKALPPPSNELFDACFRIQREACEAAGRYIPMIVENVRGAQKWVGRSAWHLRQLSLVGRCTCVDADYDEIIFEVPKRIVESITTELYKRPRLEIIWHELERPNEARAGFHANCRSPSE